MGESVNKSIDTEVYEDEEMKLSYPTVDDLAKIVKRKAKSGKRVRIMKGDLSKAYRQLWMSPESIHLLGYVFDDRYYYDVTLSMGSSASAYCCQRTSNAITYIYHKNGFENVNYLDDLGAAETDDRAEEAYDCLGYILDTIGIRESRSKACPPALIVIFLGILFNTLTMTMSITSERLEEIKQLLKTWNNKKRARLKEVQSLLGKLNFAASTVRAGRVFISRIINEINKYPEDGSLRKISKEFRKDIRWWELFMEDFDGISIIPPEKFIAPNVIFNTDSCLKGCGGWANDRAFHTAFPDWLTRKEDVHINELELTAVVIAVKKWHRRMANRNILAYCDNQVTCDIVNRGAARNKYSQACLRELCFLLAKNNSVIKLIFVPGVSNEISDCLSRFHEREARGKFRELTKGKNVQFEQISDDDFKFTHDW